MDRDDFGNTFENRCPNARVWPWSPKHVYHIFLVLLPGDSFLCGWYDTDKRTQSDGIRRGCGCTKFGKISPFVSVSNRTRSKQETQRHKGKEGFEGNKKKMHPKTLNRKCITNFLNCNIWVFKRLARASSSFSRCLDSRRTEDYVEEGRPTGKVTVGVALSDIHFCAEEPRQGLPEIFFLIFDLGNLSRKVTWVIAERLCLWAVVCFKRAVGMGFGWCCYFCCFLEGYEGILIRFGLGTEISSF